MLAINSCSCKERGKTARLLDPFLDGMRAAGAEAELCYAADLTIFPCCGNLNCTVRTPGKCMPFDDMRWLRRKIGQADVLVLASPLYCEGQNGPGEVTGPMRRLLDRLATGSSSHPEAGQCTAMCPPPVKVRLRKVVLVSGCGFLELDGFYPVLTHLKAFCKNTYPELAGCIDGLRDVRLRGMPEAEICDGITRESATRAGRQLVFEDTASQGPTSPPVAVSGPENKAMKRRRSWDSVVLYQFS